jgi:hypothetical protein
MERITYLALVRFNTGVDTVVSTKVAPCSEGFAASRARVGSFSRVGPQVDQQVGGRREQLKKECQILSVCK